MVWDDLREVITPTYTGMGISIKDIVCTTIDEDGNIVRKDRFENSFDNLDVYLSNFSENDIFVMESIEDKANSSVKDEE
jgi:hypothetical protein